MADAAQDKRVYIAYAREDRTQVEHFIAALRQFGVSLSIDADAAPGQGNYVVESQRALLDADTLLVFVSAASTKSSWVENEIRAFQAQMARGGDRQIVAVRLDDTPVPASLGGLTPINVDDLITPLPALQVLVERRTSSFLFGGAAALTSFGVYSGPGSDAAAIARDSDGWSFDWAPRQEPEGAAAGEAEPVTPPPPTPAPAPPPAPSPAPAPYFPPPQPVAGPTSGSPGYIPLQPGRAPSPSAAPVEQVTFTAYHPREMQQQQWQPLVFYISLDAPAVLAEVAAAAADRLAGRLDKFRAARSQRSAGLARGAKLRLIPVAPGFQFNPSQLDVTWQEDVQQHEFRMRAESAKPGQSVNGAVQVYQGMVLRGEVPISIFVGQAAAHLDSPDAYARAMARAYRRIFASYSHRDTAVVESCETAARTMGDQFLRDVSLLQAGVEWDPRLIQAINDADVFQLFWSKRAAQSQFVEREWQHALKLLPSRPNFIRPVYWSNPLYPTPSELNSLHFQQLSLSTLGWGPIRSALYALRNR